MLRLYQFVCSFTEYLLAQMYSTSAKLLIFSFPQQKHTQTTSLHWDAISQAPGNLKHSKIILSIFWNNRKWQSIVPSVPISSYKATKYHLLNEHTKESENWTRNQAANKYQRASELQLSFRAWNPWTSFGFFFLSFFWLVQKIIIY